MTDQHRDKLQVIWATTFLSALIAWGLTIVAFSNEPNLTPTGIALIVGILPGALAVPLLLARSGDLPSDLLVGRVLVWVQALALLVACVFAIVAITR